MSSSLSLEEQIRVIADAEFAQTSPVAVDSSLGRRSRWWIAAVAAASVLVVMVAAQLQGREGAVPVPVVHGGGVSPDAPDAVVVPDAALAVPERLRKGFDGVTALTRGSSAVVITDDELLTTADRGASWHRSDWQLQPWCPVGSQIATLHNDEFAILGLATAASSAEEQTTPYDSVYVSADGLAWREYPLPDRGVEDSARSCGLASDGDRLVVVGSFGAQFTFSILDADTGVFESTRSAGAIFAPDLNGPVRPSVVDLRYRDGRWWAAACVDVQTEDGRFRVPYPCTLDLRNVTDAMGGMLSPNVPPRLEWAGPLQATVDGLWLPSIQASTSDQNPAVPVALLNELLEEEETVMLADDSVRSGRPVVTRIESGGQVPSIPAGLSSKVTMRTVGGDTFAIVTLRRSNGVSPEAWFVLRNNAWIEVEPIEPVPWTDVDDAGLAPFTIDRWAPGRGVVGWPSVPYEGYTAQPIDYELVEANLDELRSATSVGHVWVGVRSIAEPELIWTHDPASPWRVLDATNTFGPDIAGVPCLAEAESFFYAEVTRADGGSNQVYRSADGLVWTPTDKAPEQGFLCGSR